MAQGGSIKMQWDGFTGSGKISRGRETEAGVHFAVSKKVR